MTENTVEKILLRMKEAAGVGTDTALRKVLGLSSSGSIGAAKKTGKIPHKWLLEIHRQFGANIHWLETGETPADQVVRQERRTYGDEPPRSEPAPAIEATADYWTAKSDFIKTLVELLKEHGATDEEIRDVIREHVRDARRM